jgi:OOP family OmpA-OmpF porin
MLVAIQDFVKDSFGGGDQQGVDALRQGNLTLWSEAGPYAALVAVIRGTPPESLHATLREILSRIHAERGAALQAFKGDNTGFADIDAQLRQCVEMRQEATHSRIQGFPWLAVLLVLGLLGALTVWGVRSWIAAHHWNAYRTALSQEPGIVVVSTDKYHGIWNVEGMRDPEAVDPATLLQRYSLATSNVSFHWEPYQSLNPHIVMRRLQDVLRPPTTLGLQVMDNRVVASGAAPDHWLRRARIFSASLPVGAPAVDWSSVRIVDDGAFDRLRAVIESEQIRFDSGKPLPPAGEDATLDLLASQIKELERVSNNLKISSRVMLTGHSDSVGQGLSNLNLSVARAEGVRSLLRKRGVDPDLLAVRGAGPLEPQSQDPSVNRRVSVGIDIIGQ